MAVRRKPVQKKLESSHTNRLRFHWAPGSYEWPERTVERSVGRGGAPTPITLARVSVAYGRMLTLDAVGEVEPGVLDELNDEPRRALERSGWDQRRDGALTNAVLVTDPRLRELRASLREWCERWHLVDQWCLEIALSTLTHKSNAARLTWFNPQTSFSLRGMAPPLRAPLAPPLGLSPYDPTQEWRSDYLYSARIVLNPRCKTLSDELTECVNAVSRSSSAVEQDRLLERARELGDRLHHAPESSLLAKSSSSAIILIGLNLRRGPRASLRFPRIATTTFFSGWQPVRCAAGVIVTSPRRAMCIKIARLYHNAVVRGIKKLSHHIGLTTPRRPPAAPRGANLKYLINKFEKALTGELAKDARNREAALRRPERRD